MCRFRGFLLHFWRRQEFGDKFGSHVPKFNGEPESCFGSTGSGEGSAQRGTLRIFGFRTRTSQFQRATSNSIARMEFAWAFGPGIFDFTDQKLIFLCQVIRCDPRGRHTPVCVTTMSDPPVIRPQASIATKKPYMIPNFTYIANLQWDLRYFKGIASYDSKPEIACPIFWAWVWDSLLIFLQNERLI